MLKDIFCSHFWQFYPVVHFSTAYSNIARYAFPLCEHWHGDAFSSLTRSSWIPSGQAVSCRVRCSTLSIVVLCQLYSILSSFPLLSLIALCFGCHFLLMSPIILYIPWSYILHSISLCLRIVSPAISLCLLWQLFVGPTSLHFCQYFLSASSLLSLFFFKILFSWTRFSVSVWGGISSFNIYLRFSLLQTLDWLYIHVHKHTVIPWHS